MNKKKEIVPKLRFPEFVNEDEWKNKRIEQLLTIGNGCDYKHLSKGDIPVYGSGGYMCSVDDFLYDGDSVCIGRKGTIDKPIFLRGKFWTVDTLFYTHSYKNCIPKFIYNIFQKINWLKYNEAGGVPSLSKTTINKINIYIPKIPEQQKIADCLSSIDELIDAESRKLEVLEKYKKGLMQKLFPAEGKTLPEWRFPEFQGCGEWKLQKLKLICDFQEGYAFSSNDFVANDTDSNYIQVVRITDINNKNSNTDKVFVNMDLIRRNDLYKYLISKNDLILSLTGAAGFNFFIWNTNIAVLNQRTLKLIPKDEKNHAIKFLIEPLIHKEINMHGTGQNNNLSKEVLKNVEIVLPTSFKEQHKIADCLSEIDTIITEQSNKVEQLKAHKKGLMQGLFPSLEEADV